MYFQTIEYIIKLYHKEVIVMIETRQNSYLVRYAVKLLIFTEIFMFMTIIVQMELMKLQEKQEQL